MKSLATIRNLLLFILSIFFSMPIYSWYLKPGQVYMGYYAVKSSADKVTYDDGRAADFPKIYWFSQFLAVSVGVFKRTEINAVLGYVNAREADAPQLNVNSLSDIWLGLGYSPWSEADSEWLSVKLRADIKFPLVNYPTSQHTAIGQGQNDYRFTINASKFFGWGRVALQPFVEPGIIFRASEPLDQFIYKSGLLVVLFEDFRLGAGISGLKTLGGSKFGEPGWNYLNLGVWYTALDLRAGYTLMHILLIDLFYSKTLVSGNSLLFDSFGGHLGFTASF